MLKIRPVWKADELKRFGELEEKYHYMGETHSGGDTLRLVIEDDGDLGRDRARPSVSTAAGNSRPPVHGMPSLSVSTTIRSMEAAEESNANGRAVSMKPPVAAASSMPPYLLCISLNRHSPPGQDSWSRVALQQKVERSAK